jgi:signal transduction histidine kinase
LLEHDGQLRDHLEADHLETLQRLYRPLGHELRGTINSIVLHLEVLRRSLRRIDDEALARDLGRSIESIGAAAKHYRRLVDGVIAQLAPHTSGTEAEPWRELLEGVRTLAQSFARHRQVELREERLEEGLEELPPPLGDPSLCARAGLQLLVAGVADQKTGAVANLTLERRPEGLAVAVNAPEAGWAHGLEALERTALACDASVSSSRADGNRLVELVLPTAAD